MAGSIGSRPEGRRTVEDWFLAGNPGDEFESLLDAAAEESSTAHNDAFVADMQAKWEQFGLRMWLTHGQLNYLERIAGVEETPDD